MTSVRPTNPTPPQPNVARPADNARLAAQRAFFDLAAGKAQAAAAPAAIATASVAPRPAAAPQRRPDPAAEPPTRVLRPGSLLDIRV